MAQSKRFYAKWSAVSTAAGAGILYLEWDLSQLQAIHEDIGLELSLARWAVMIVAASVAMALFSRSFMPALPKVEPPRPKEGTRPLTKDEQRRMPSPDRYASSHDETLFEEYVRRGLGTIQTKFIDGKLVKEFTPTNPQWSLPIDIDRKSGKSDHPVAEAGGVEP